MEQGRALAEFRAHRRSESRETESAFLERVRSLAFGVLKEEGFVGKGRANYDQVSAKSLRGALGAIVAELAARIASLESALEKGE